MERTRPVSSRLAEVVCPRMRSSRMLETSALPHRAADVLMLRAATLAAMGAYDLVSCIPKNEKSLVSRQRTNARVKTYVLESTALWGGRLGQVERADSKWTHCHCCVCVGWAEVKRLGWVRDVPQRGILALQESGDGGILLTEDRRKVERSERDSGGRRWLCLPMSSSLCWCLPLRLFIRWPQKSLSAQDWLAAVHRGRLELAKIVWFLLIFV